MGAHGCQSRNGSVIFICIEFYRFHAFAPFPQIAAWGAVSVAQGSESAFRFSLDERAVGNAQTMFQLIPPHAANNSSG
jgi:hypothetical protein